MAQSRERRNQRRRQQARTRPVTATAASPTTVQRRNLRRVVIAFLILVGLAGIMTISAPSEDPAGAPVSFVPR
jgi:hypothetical protein